MKAKATPISARTDLQHQMYSDCDVGEGRLQSQCPEQRLHPLRTFKESAHPVCEKAYDSSWCSSCHPAGVNTSMLGQFATMLTTK